MLLEILAAKIEPTEKGMLAKHKVSEEPSFTESHYDGDRWATFFIEFIGDVK